MYIRRNKRNKIFSHNLHRLWKTFKYRGIYYGIRMLRWSSLVSFNDRNSCDYERFDATKTNEQRLIGKAFRYEIRACTRNDGDKNKTSNRSTTIIFCERFFHICGQLVLQFAWRPEIHIRISHERVNSKRNQWNDQTASDKLPFVVSAPIIFQSRFLQRANKWDPFQPRTGTIIKSTVL